MAKRKKVNPYKLTARMISSVANNEGVISVMWYEV